jgi:hypothetical protein
MDERLVQGIALFNDGEFFRCHEVLEETWRLERGPRRRFLQAVIHVAVGFYHSQRGNPAGAVAQLRKGLEKLAGYAPSYEGINTAQLYRDALAATEAIEGGVGLPRIHGSTPHRTPVLICAGTHHLGESNPPRKRPSRPDRS